jgi:hypothetical protein
MASTAVASATWLRRQGGPADSGARIHTWSSLVQVGTGPAGGVSCVTGPPRWRLRCSPLEMMSR